MLSRRTLSPWFLLALVLVLGYVSLQVVGVFLNYVLSGLFIAYITHPLYDKLEAKLKWPPLAALFMVAIVALVVIVPTAFMLVQLIDELRGLLINLDPVTLEQQFTAMTDRLLQLIGREPTPTDPGGVGLFDAIVPSINGLVSNLASNLLGVLAEGVIGTFVLLYILYYAYTDGHKFVDNVRDLIPLNDANRTKLMDDIGNVIGGVLYGHVLTAMIQAALAAIGYIIFGVPNVVFWASITFILALLPVVGPPLIWFPWGVVLLLQGHTFAGIGLLVYSAIMVSSLDNIIRPKLIGDRADVHPTVVLLGVLGGVVLFGFSGLILGPLVLSIFLTILEMVKQEILPGMDDEPLGD